jgi:hypothetical protein
MGLCPLLPLQRNAGASHQPEPAASFLTPGPNKQSDQPSSEDQLSIQATAVRKPPPPAFRAASFLHSSSLSPVRVQKRRNAGKKHVRAWHLLLLSPLV